MGKRTSRTARRSQNSSAENAARAPRDWSALFPSGELRFAAFIFRLPWQLPINSGSTFSFELEGQLDVRWNFDSSFKPVEGKGDFVDARTRQPAVRNFRRPFVSVRTWQVTRDQDLSYLTEPVSSVADVVFGKSKAPRDRTARTEQTYETIIEAVTQAAVADDEAVAPDVAAATFERCLSALNRLMLSYAIAVRDPDFEFASPGTLDPFVMLATRPLDHGYDKGPVLYMLNSLRLPFAKPMLEPQAVRRVMRFASALTAGNPFLQPARFAVLAQRAHRSGDNAGVLVATASAGELLLNTTLKLMLVEEDESARYDAMLAEDSGLAARVRKHYPSRLGGNWNLEDVGVPIGEWWSKVQVLRGRVLHGGQWPTHGEADEAIAAGTKLERFIGDRLTATYKRYPKTALSQVGPEGLRRRGLSDKTVDAVIAAHDKHLDAFWKAAGGIADIRRPD